MSKALSNKVDRRIRKFFSSRWSATDANYFLRKIDYQLDISSVQQNLNIPIRDFVLRGGKRIRPVLFLTTLQAFGVNYNKYIDLAVLIELVHNGTLVLDDIEDDADLRRGKPAAHKTYGLDSATNMGMSLHVLPLRILSKLEKYLTPKQQLRLWNIYADEVINVSFGQALDIHWHKTHPTHISVKKYMEMVRLKTGSLMRMSLRMACVVANKNHKTEKICKNFAENLGIAFQIIDDCLDLENTVQNGKMLGKTFGNDITEGKYSLPVILALSRLKKRKRNRLVKILSIHTRNKKYITEAVSIIYKTGSVTDSKLVAKKLLDKSWKALKQELSEEKQIDELYQLTQFMIQRAH